MFITGMSEFAVELSKALGEDPKKVRGVMLNCSVDEVVTVAIERYVDEPTAEKILEVIRKHVWMEDPEEKA